PPSPAKPATLVDAAVAERSRQEAALLRRLQVCDKLKDIAVRNQDQELLRQAEELEERAQATYAQRTAHVPGSNRRSEGDEKRFEQDEESDKPHATDTSPYTV